MDLSKLGILPATGYAEANPKIFSNLSYAAKIPTYVGLPIDEIKDASKSMHDAYDTNLAKKDTLDLAIANINVLPIDQKHKDAQVQKIKGLFEDLYTNDNWENAQQIVSKATKDFMMNEGLNKATQSYKAYNDYKQTLMDRVEKGEITQQAMYKELADANKQYEQQGGIHQDPNADNAYVGVYSGKQPPKYIDVAAKLHDFYKDWSKNQVLGLVHDGKVENFQRAPGGYFINGTTEFIKDAEVQEAMKNYLLGQKEYKESYDYYTSLDGRNGKDAHVSDLQAYGITDDVALKNAGIPLTLAELAEPKNQAMLNDIYDRAYQGTSLNRVLQSASAPISFDKYTYDLKEDKIGLKALDYKYDLGKMAVTQKYAVELQDKKHQDDIELERLKGNIIDNDGQLNQFNISGIKPDAIKDFVFETTQATDLSTGQKIDFNQPKYIDVPNSGVGYIPGGGGNGMTQVSNPNYFTVSDYLKAASQGSKNGMVTVTTQGGKQLSIPVPKQEMLSMYNILPDAIKNSDDNTKIMKEINKTRKEYYTTAQQNVQYYTDFGVLKDDKKKELNQTIFGKNVGTEKDPNYTIGNIATKTIYVQNDDGTYSEPMSYNDFMDKNGLKNSDMSNANLLGKLDNKRNAVTASGYLATVKDKDNKQKNIIISDISINDAKVKKPLFDLVSPNYGIGVNQSPPVNLGPGISSAFQNAGLLPTVSSQKVIYRDEKTGKPNYAIVISTKTTDGTKVVLNYNPIFRSNFMINNPDATQQQFEQYAKQHPDEAFSDKNMEIPSWGNVSLDAIQDFIIKENTKLPK